MLLVLLTLLGADLNDVVTPAPAIAPIAPAVPDAPPSPPSSPSPDAAPAGGVVEVAPPPAATTAGAPVKRRVLRVAVKEIEAEGLSARASGIVSASLVAELRKLDGVSVVGMDEMRALLQHEADRQLVGCTESGCLAEIAEALGADVLITAQVATLGEDDVVSFRRVGTATAEVRGVDRRFAHGNGEAFLAAIGPAVAELFPELPLRAGVERGVEREQALRLNPPPLPAWGFWTVAASTAGVLAVGVGAGAVHSVVLGRAQERVDQSATSPITGAELKGDVDVANGAALVANGAFVAAAALGVGAGVAALFTDFSGHGD